MATGQDPKSPEFTTQFDPRHGEAVAVANGVTRITAPNAGPFTFHGTNSYLVGNDQMALIDPGPNDETHLKALLSAIGKRSLTHIIVTHTHVDHSPLAAKLKKATGATIYGEGRHRPARELNIGEINPLDASADRTFEPDIAVEDGQTINGEGWRLVGVATPGHTANHMVFALDGTDVLFSGDHVMAWATSIVAPPDGLMSDYMRSLDAVLKRDETCYLPGHGGRVSNARDFVRALKSHRKMRERAILERIRSGDRSIPTIVAAIYKGLDPRLVGAASLSVLAHMEDLVARDLVGAKGSVSIDTDYFDL